MPLNGDILKPLKCCLKMGQNYIRFASKITFHVRDTALSPLMMAAHKGRFEIVKYLTENRVDFEFKSE